MMPWWEQDLQGGEFWGANRELELEKGASRGRSQQISVAWQLWQQAPGTGVLFLKAEVCSDCSAELLSPGQLLRGWKFLFIICLREVILVLFSGATGADCTSPSL